MRIRTTEIGSDQPVYVIGEAGSNHAGFLDDARRLIDVASDAGCNAVKFQCWRPEDISKRPDTIERRFGDISDWLPTLAAHAHSRDLDFIVSVFSEWAVNVCSGHVDAWKVASFEPYCTFVDRLSDDRRRPKIVSFGQLTPRDQRKMMHRRRSRDLWAWLHCTSLYPTPYAKTAISRLAHMCAKNFTERVIGYSSHTAGFVDVIAAAAVGAMIVEKHFRLDAANQKPAPDDLDHSLRPGGLRAMVEAIRMTEECMKLHHPYIAIADPDRRVNDAR